MILESLVIIGFALGLDFTFGDPKNRYHPTAWIGTIIAKLTTLTKNENPYLEKLGGIFIIIIPVVVILSSCDTPSIKKLNFESIICPLLSK